MPYIGKQPANVPVTADDIPNDSITSAKILDNVITISDIGPNAVGNSEMADDAVGLNELSAGGTTNTSTFLRGDNSWAVPPNTVYTHPNHSGDVTSSADGATTIANNAVTTGKINDGDVTTAKLAADCITAVKIADDVINATHIEDGQILTAALGDDAVTAAKLANSINTDIAKGPAALPKAGGTMTGNLNITKASASAIITSTGSGNDASVLFATPSNSRGMYLDDSDSNKIKIYTGHGKGTAGKEVTVDNNGNVGIGVTDPDMKLEVNGQIKIDSSISGDNIMAIINSASDGYGPYFKAGGGNTSQFLFKLLNYSGSEKFRVDGAGNVGIGQAPEAWRSVQTSLDIGDCTAISSHTSNYSYFAHNYYHDGAEKYKNTDAASLIELSHNGDIHFRNAASGSADAAISFSTPFSILIDGRGLSQFTAKAWVTYNQENTPAILDSHNISSMTDRGTGLGTMNFANAMGNANYCVVGSALDGGGENDNRIFNHSHSTAETTSAFAFFTGYVNTSAEGGLTYNDTARLGIQVFGD